MNDEDTILVAPEKEITPDDYYKDSHFCSFSGLKVFSKCETLYRDIFIDKVYDEPEKDYFVYGKLVDAFLTETPAYVAENFIRVDKRVNPEDALRIENKITNLKEEVAKKQSEILAKTNTKKMAIIEKIEKLEPDSPKLAKLNQDLLDCDANPDKVLTKGISTRLETIMEENAKLDLIKEYANKQQVIGSIWENAVETADTMKAHPHFSTLDFNEMTSQQIFTCTINGVPCKGKLDHLRLSPAISKIYAVWKVNKMTLDEMRAAIQKLSPEDHYATITDIKTCRDLALLEPYNNQYRGQLGYYRNLVATVLGIPKANIKMRILVADKVSNKFKKAELFEYGNNVVEDLEQDIEAWKQIWLRAMTTKTFVSAKQKHGMKQDCFTCTDCRFAPFSRKPGEAVVITGPRFGSSALGDLSIADTLLDY